MAQRQAGALGRMASQVAAGTQSRGKLLPASQQEEEDGGLSAEEHAASSQQQHSEEEEGGDVSMREQVLTVLLQLSLGEARCIPAP